MKQILKWVVEKGCEYSDRCIEIAYAFHNDSMEEYLRNKRDSKRPRLTPVL